MSYIDNPIDQTVVAALQAFVMAMLGLPMSSVITAHENGVPMPLDNFVMISHLTHKSYAMTTVSYDGVSTETVTQPMDYPFQIDFYGPGASDWAIVIQSLFKTEIATTNFEAFGAANSITIEPLYAEDAAHTAIVNEENQYEERWTLKVHINVLFSIPTAQQFLTTTPKVGTINAPRTYPR